MKKPLAVPGGAARAEPAARPGIHRTAAVGAAGAGRRRRRCRALKGGAIDSSWVFIGAALRHRRCRRWARASRWPRWAPRPSARWPRSPSCSAAC